MRAPKPTSVCDPNESYQWEWIEWWEMENGEWRPIPKDAVVSIFTTTRWGRYYKPEVLAKLKRDTPFLSVKAGQC